MKKYGIIAIGDGAGLAITNFSKSDLYDRIAINTNKTALNKLDVDIKFLVGKNLCKGLSCAGNSITGQDAFEESKDEILNLIKNYEKIFIIACLGGGVGTGVTVALSKYLCSNFLIIVTKPFTFESKRHLINANEALEDLNKLNIKPVVLINDNMEKFIPPNATLGEAFLVINDKICEEIRKIIE